MSKPTERNRIHKQPNRRPYASRISVILNDTDQFGLGEGACLLVNDDHIITFMPRLIKAGKRDVQQICATVEGFATAGEAENAGIKLSAAILWVAASMKCPLRLDYHTPLPCVVYDRTEEGGIRLSCSAQAERISSPQKIVRLLQQIYCRDEMIDRTLLVSMELFASARLEVTERTRFLGLVSALEPIAKQQNYGEPVDNLVHQCLAIIEKSSEIPAEIRPSLIGRISDLRRESVMQAIYRLVEHHLPDNQSALATVKEAYGVRSKIVHEGSTDADLNELSNAVEEVIRLLYSRILDLELVAPIAGLSGSRGP